MHAEQEKAQTIQPAIECSFQHHTAAAADLSKEEKSLIRDFNLTFK